MPQILLADNIPALIKASTTTCTLAATHLGQPTRIKIGGQQYKLSSSLTCNIVAANGAGAFDSGVFTDAQLVYVYAIVNRSSFSVALIASQASPSSGPLMPSGYGSAYTLVGAFYGNGTSLIGSTVTIVGTASTDFMSFTPIAVSGFTGGTLAGFWRREADCMVGEMSLVSPTTWVAAALDIRFAVGPLTVDLAKFPVTPAGEQFPIGDAVFTDSSVGTRYLGTATLGAIAAGSIRCWSTAGADVWAVGASRPVLGQNGADSVHINFSVPISGWTKTLLG